MVRGKDVGFGAAADWVRRTESILKVEEKKPVRKPFTVVFGTLGSSANRSPMDMEQAKNSGYRLGFRVAAKELYDTWLDSWYNRWCLLSA